MSASVPYFRFSAVQEEATSTFPIPFFRLLALTPYAKKKKNKNWTCTVCISTQKTSQKTHRLSCTSHFNGIIVMPTNWRFKATTSFKAFWEVWEWKLACFESFPLAVNPPYQVFSWTWNSIFALVSLSILHLKVWELSGPSSGRGHDLRQVCGGNGLFISPLLFTRDFSLLENALWII